MCLQADDDRQLNCVSSDTLVQLASGLIDTIMELIVDYRRRSTHPSTAMICPVLQKMPHVQYIESLNPVDCIMLFTHYVQYPSKVWTHLQGFFFIFTILYIVQ